MSKAYDAAYEFLDRPWSAVERALGQDITETIHEHKGMCWRCGQSNDRKGLDWTCEGCLAFISGETKDDPALFIPEDVRRGWPNS